MTKKKDKKEPVKVIEKSEWQKRHEEFVARRAAKKAEEEKRIAEEREKAEAEVEAESAETQEGLEKDEKPEADDREETSELDESEKVNQSEEADKSSEGDDEVTQAEPEKEGNTLSSKEEKTDKKELKAQAKADKKAKNLEKKRLGRPMRIARLKVASIIFVALVTLVLSGFILTPFSKEKKLTVTGLTNTDESTVLIATGIKKSDYITSVFLNMRDYEKAIIAADPWVKSAKMTYHFPNTFEIAVTENRIIAYAQTKSGYQPVLENGVRMPLVSEAKLPASFLTVNLTDEKAVQSLVAKLAKLDQKLVSSIQVVNPIKNAATEDLIALEVKEGHIIRVPLSQIEVKLPFYSKIVSNLTEPSIIDMEVGIYTTTATIEDVMAQEKAEREEAKKKAEEEAKKADSTSENSDQTSESSQSNSDETETTEISESTETGTTEETSTASSSE